jgi:glucose-6-phosphate isomerase
MSSSWQNFLRNYCHIESLGISLDISCMHADEAFFARMAPPMERACREMRELEAGAIANPDENRMVGHYWLRSPELAPNPQIGAEIRDGIDQVKRFAADVHKGIVRPASCDCFSDVLCIGIGGSALGPMLLADALGHPSSDRVRTHFLDNTDPDGIERTITSIGRRLAGTLCVVTSKSGGTPETRNGMILAQKAYEAAGLEFARHAVGITMPGSNLDRQARSQHWLAVFPMFDWIGGRTSITSAVGILPAALQSLDIDALLAGAATCDEATRETNIRHNPAALMALMWYHATDGRGTKDMVVLPYKDRLLLFSRYLQQLNMESLGKRLDREGRTVEQGLTVYGNKGSTDQHAYVQQLRDGIRNFFVTFIRVLEDGGDPAEIESGTRAGDYLNAFLLGTREALSENDRQSMTITIPRVDARSMGALVALFERAVGYYASLININAYHQPGVEAGKKAAASILELQGKISGALSRTPQSAEQIVQRIGGDPKTELVYYILEHLAANGRAQMNRGSALEQTQFSSV